MNARLLDEVILNTQKNQMGAESLKSERKMECKAEVQKEVERVLPAAVEQGLWDLPFKMVCVSQDLWYETNSVISYNRITVEASNSNQPGGSMNIETGVCTTVTSGYYIITFSSIPQVTTGAGDSIAM